MTFTGARLRLEVPKSMIRGTTDAWHEIRCLLPPGVYLVNTPYNEMYPDSGAARSHYQRYDDWLKTQPAERLAQKRAEADALFHRVGITFAVYGQEEGAERLIPFDIVPRVLPTEEWVRLEAGLKQRVRALNAFIHDIYHDQQILKAGIIPAEQVLCNSQYRPEMQGVDVPGGIYAHIAGIDIIRDDAGEFRVLEDNLRVPSGVSYMLENRKMMMRLFPELFSEYRIAPIERYPEVLLENLRSVAPTGVADPTVVLLTAGAHNSAYFEHAFLAQQMGVELVEGQDLFVRDEAVYMRTTQGAQRVDVIYRRIDDDFLDPLVFRPDSMLGVPGLLAAYREGRITIANAIGTGVADDKSIYPYVPDMIRFYLGQSPMIGNVHTWMLRRPDDLQYVLEHLPELVVKEVHGAGGYGMLIGPAASQAEIEVFRRQIVAAPERYIAQPTLALSTCPDVRRPGTEAPAHRPAPVRALGPRGHHRPRRPHAGGAARGVAGGELLAGRRHQGYLGAGKPMLSRTADHLYWMSRYVERAESLARLVDAHYRMSLLPQSGDNLTQSLSTTMTALHVEQAYRERHEAVVPQAVFEFLSLDRDHAGSIVNCLRAARENARAVRGSLTSELWETLNSTWLDARSFMARSTPRTDIGHFVEWVKERSHLTRGVTIGTMLRDEAFHFTRIGTFIERADSTARILTAHQNDLKPGADAAVVPDPYQWSVLLRALSAFEVYRRVYRDVITPLQGGAAADPARRHAALAHAMLQGGLSEPPVGLERGVEGNRAARRRITRYAAFHAHGGHHRGGPAVFSAAIPGSAARSGRPRGVGLPGSPGRGINACSFTSAT